MASAALHQSRRRALSRAATVTSFCLLMAFPGFAGSNSGHWAFQPLRTSPPPTHIPTPPGWQHSPIDAFILARLGQEGLAPAARAAPRELLRRASLQLTGLPPSLDEAAAFAQSTQPDAFARAVDRLLQSPHYGERWGRWWLDLARYADSNGQDENKFMAHAWRYRDWVIGSFNQNLPFDRFITLQLAGDLLPEAGVSERELGDRWTATGFLVLGPKMLAEQDKPKLVMDLVDEQIDTIGRAFLGMTVQCARCHDHKFDPIPTEDYYALAGIFKSTRTMADLAFVSTWNERSIATETEKKALAEFTTRTNSLQQSIQASIQRADASVLMKWREQSWDYAVAAAQLAAIPAGSNRSAALTAHAGTTRLHPPTLERWILASTTHPTWALLTNGLPALAEEAWQLHHTKDPRPLLGSGRIGSGLRLTGQNHVSEPHSDALEPAQLTLQAWVRIDEVPMDQDARRWLAGKNDNEWEEGHYSLFLEGQQPGAYLNIGGGATHVFMTRGAKESVPLKEWVHLAMTYDARDLVLYVNGQPAGSTRVDRPRLPGSGMFCIGKRGDGHRFFKGALDEVQLSGTAMSADAVMNCWKRQQQGLPDSPSDRIQSWSFEATTEAGRRELVVNQAAEAFFGKDGLLNPPADRRPFWTQDDRAAVASLEAERGTVLSNAPPAEPFVMSVRDDKPTNLPVHVRGSHLSHAGQPIPRGFIQVIHRNAASSIGDRASGRLELAQWLTAPEHPLTSRVTVNRIWQALFGEGLVRSSDNFGIRGDPPTHPELLDWLAIEFIRSGWDVKHLIRLITASATYQQSSRAPDASAGVSQDPENRLLGRFPRQRMEAEMIRDSILAVSGQLDRRVGGALVPWKNNEYVPGDETPFASLRRSVYLPVIRDRGYDVMNMFDMANPSVGASKRASTTVAHQALFFMNSPLVKSACKAWAQSLRTRAGSEKDRIHLAHRMIFGRSASDLESRRCLDFLASVPGETAENASEKAWASLCQVLLSSNEFISVE